MTETIPAPLAGERVDRVVAMLTGCSRAEAAAAVAAGHVELDGRVCRRGADRVAEGQELTVTADPTTPARPPRADPRVAVTVVHEDADLVVVDKPAGLVVHPGAGNPDGTLVAGLLARFPELAGVGEDPSRPGIVHRLDRGTSGLLVVARTPAASAALVDQLATHSMGRRYLALVRGRVDEASGTIDAPVGRSRRDPLVMAVTPEGRPAVTHYEVRGVWDRPEPVTLLECRLETGRTHQIRVHLQAIGHPVVGDRAYGGDRSAITLGRPFLHAWRLDLRHPRTGEPCAFESPLPPDLEEVLAGLG